MEKLWELHEEGRWELIVLDTPPTRSALDFLDAPQEVTDFLEGRFLKLILWPYLKPAGRPQVRELRREGVPQGRVTRITGSELLEDVAGLLPAFEGMYETFKERAKRVYDLMPRDAPRSSSCRRRSRLRSGRRASSSSGWVPRRCRSAGSS